jgi:radical SAM superfamily enzyme YgiQ (UPF0313 family)
MNINNALFRPPAEANSLILQIDQGCPANHCTFCAMYRGIPYRKMPLDEIRQLISQTSRVQNQSRRIFLADGNVMNRSFEDLQQILQMLNDSFPDLSRISLYANGRSIARKSPEQLRRLRTLKLHTLYMGLESGDQEILKSCRKGETVAQMIDAGQLAQAAGLRMSVMVLLGLGGAEKSQQHARHTAEALNKMQPRLLSALRVIPIKGTELYRDVTSGKFQQLSEWAAVGELRDILKLLDLKSTVFRANHNSNVIPLEGRLPRSKDRLLAELTEMLDSGMLDKNNPGRTPLIM